MAITRNFSGSITKNGTTYTVEVDIVFGGTSSDELSTDSYLYNTDNRYTKHGIRLWPRIRVKNSSGSYVYPSVISDCSFRMIVGYDVFECNLNGKPIYNDSSRNCSYIHVYFDNDVYRAYTPGQSSRNDDSITFDFKPTGSVNGSYGKFSGNLSYPPYYQASFPTTNYAVIGMGQTLTIYTNRMNSNITHTIRYGICSNNGYKIWDTTKTDYATGNRWIGSLGDGVGKTLATGVGASYSWSIPSSTSSLFYSSSVSDGFYDLVIDVESFYNNISLGRRTVVVKLFKANSTSIICGYNYVQITDTAVSTNYSRKHFVAGKSNLRVSGSVKCWVNQSGYSHQYIHDTAFQADAPSRPYYQAGNSSTSSTSRSFTIYNAVPSLSSVMYDVSWGDYRYKPGIRDFNLSTNYQHTTPDGGATSTSDRVTIDYYISPYNSPSISALNIYRVDDNDNRDSEGQYMHIKCSCSNTAIGDMNNRGDGDNQSIFDINSIQLKMYYKKVSDSSWSNVTLVPTKYENYINYDQRYSGATFDPTSIYEFRFELTDKFETVTRSVTIRPPIILIDYNASGTALAFGKISDAPAGASYIESIMPIIFEDTANRSTSWTGGTLGAITQTGTNSSNYFNIMVGRSSTGYRRYGITIYDNDTASNADMRLYSSSSYISIQQTKAQYYNSYNGYYFEVNPVSTYCNLNTSSSYFYTNKDIYMQGNLVATQSWVNNKSYATQTWVENKSYVTWSNVLSNLSGSSYNCGISGNDKSDLTDFGSYEGQNKLYLVKNGTTTFQIHWGRLGMGTVPSSYDGQYVLRQSCSFSPSFGKAPIVVATPVLNRNGSSHQQWKCDCTICSVSTSSFTAEVTAEGFQGGLSIMWFAIGSY